MTSPQCRGPLPRLLSGETRSGPADGRNRWWRQDVACHRGFVPGVPNQDWQKRCIWSETPALKQRERPRLAAIAFGFKRELSRSRD